MEAIIQVIESTIGARDPYTVGHQQRVTDIACSIAREMGVEEGRIQGLRVAGTLHDLGKVAVPQEILAKPGKLSDAEFAMIKGHPQMGFDILQPLEIPGQVSQIILQHHERMDGSGYPRGLWGEDIILEARILGVADVVEAMCSHRPYRPALGTEKALEEISLNKGILYDAAVVDACLRVYEKARVADESLVPRVSPEPWIIPASNTPRGTQDKALKRTRYESPWTWTRRFIQETRFHLQATVALILGWMMMMAQNL